MHHHTETKILRNLGRMEVVHGRPLLITFHYNKEPALKIKQACGLETLGSRFRIFRGIIFCVVLSYIGRGLATGRHHRVHKIHKLWVKFRPEYVAA